MSMFGVFFAILAVWCMAISPAPKQQEAILSVESCVCTKDIMTSLGKFTEDGAYTYSSAKTKYYVFLEEGDRHSGLVFGADLFDKHFELTD